MLICALCNEHPANQEHHKLPNTKVNRKIYGSLIDKPFNKEAACSHCNASHRNIPAWARWDETKFREEAVKDGHKLPPGSKTFLMKNAKKLDS